MYKVRRTVEAGGRSKVAMGIKSQSEEVSSFPVNGRESFKMF